MPRYDGPSRAELMQAAQELYAERAAVAIRDERADNERWRTRDDVEALQNALTDATRRYLKAEEALDRVRELHVPMPGDQYAEQRCRGCIAGYDPRTGELVNCAWPCPTISALDQP